MTNSKHVKVFCYIGFEICKNAFPGTAQVRHTKSLNEGSMTKTCFLLVKKDNLWQVLKYSLTSSYSDSLILVASNLSKQKILSFPLQLSTRLF